MYMFAYTQIAKSICNGIQKAFVSFDSFSYSTFCVWNEKSFSYAKERNEAQGLKENTQISFWSPAKSVKTSVLVPMEQKLCQKCLHGDALNYSYFKEGTSAVEVSSQESL